MLSVLNVIISRSMRLYQFIIQIDTHLTWFKRKSISCSPIIFKWIFSRLCLNFLCNTSIWWSIQLNDSFIMSGHFIVVQVSPSNLNWRGWEPFINLIFILFCIILTPLNTAIILGKITIRNDIWAIWPDWRRTRFNISN